MIMLIGNVMEKTPPTIVMENMASRLADRVRNIWLENREKGMEQWEENFFEDPDGIRFLRSESFPDLVGIDYIFKWWGSADVEGLAGELEVLWKVRKDAEMNIYKSWIRFADRNFILGQFQDERQKREHNQAEFRKAFRTWQQCYMEQ